MSTHQPPNEKSEDGGNENEQLRDDIELQVALELRIAVILPLRWSYGCGSTAIDVTVAVVCADRLRSMH